MTLRMPFRRKSTAILYRTPYFKIFFDGSAGLGTIAMAGWVDGLVTVGWMIVRGGIGTIARVAWEVGFGLWVRRV
jgi:hypothetical protein